MSRQIINPYKNKARPNRSPLRLLWRSNNLNTSFGNDLRKSNDTSFGGNESKDAKNFEIKVLVYN